MKRFNHAIVQKTRWNSVRVETALGEWRGSVDAFKREFSPALTYCVPDNPIPQADAPPKRETPVVMRAQTVVRKALRLRVDTSQGTFTINPPALLASAIADESINLRSAEQLLRETYDWCDDAALFYVERAETVFVAVPMAQCELSELV